MVAEDSPKNGKDTKLHEHWGIRILSENTAGQSGASFLDVKNSQC